MKIGILIKDFEALENWELRVIESIKNDANLELSVLIKDGRDEHETNQSKKKPLGEFIYSLQFSIEKFIYRNEIVKTVNKVLIVEYLKKIQTVEGKSISKDFIDITSEADLKCVKEYNLDLLLNLGFYKIGEGILSLSKYGIWFLVQGNSLKKTGPPGFWEVLNKESVVSVTLMQLTSENGKGRVIDKSYHNPHRHWSFVKTNSLILESSVSLLLKNIKELEERNYVVSKSEGEFSSTFDPPNILSILKYGFIFYGILINKFFQKFFELLGKRYECWTLFIGKGNFMESDLSKIEPVNLPKGEFWADPFLFMYRDEYFVFFERYPYNSKKGIISCGKVIGNKLVNVVDVLDLPYHLSYPFVFEEDGGIYMMPETMQNKRLEIYKCISFPDKWELFSTAFDNEIVADATFYNDQQEEKWLFVTKKTSPNTDTTSELFIYKVDSLELNILIPHRQNPVIIDTRIARSAGPVFERDGNLYRPSQCSSDAIYGKALNINRIEKLNLEEYSEENVYKIEPNFQKKFMSIHHLHQVKDLFIFDAAYKKK